MTAIGDTRLGTTPSEPPHGRPPRSRYWIAGLVAVVGVIVSLVCSFATLSVASNRADEFVRAGIPGQITLHVDSAATYYIYAEGSASRHPSVQVTGPGGQAVRAQSTSPGPSYYHGGNGGSAVAKFDAAQRGDYKIAVSTAAGAQGDFAVAGRFPLWLRLADWGAGAALIVFPGAGLVIVMWTAIQRRRPKAA
jgi:hypothetical protein